MHHKTCSVQSWNLFAVAKPVIPWWLSVIQYSFRIDAHETSACHDPTSCCHLIGSSSFARVPFNPLCHSIGQWHGNGEGKHCPICHVPLPRKLLKLYYEPQKDAGEDAAISASPTSGSGTGKGDSVSSAEFTHLRRKVASSEKVRMFPRDAAVDEGDFLPYGDALHWHPFVCLSF